MIKRVTTCAVFLALAVMRLYSRVAPSTAQGVFRRLQLLSAAAYSLGHGANDAQKTMGVIAVLLFTTGHLGNWEMLVLGFAALYEPISYLARPLDNPLLDAMLS